MNWKRVKYLVGRWLMRHRPQIQVRVEVNMPETNHVVADGFFFLSKEELFKAFGLHSKKLYITGVRWSVVEDRLKITVRGTEIPDCGGQIVSVDPIHTEKELRDAKRALEDA